MLWSPAGYSKINLVEEPIMIFFRQSYRKLSKLQSILPYESIINFQVY